MAQADTVGPERLAGGRPPRGPRSVADGVGARINTTGAARGERGRRPYSTQVAGVLLAAFTLSLGYTVYTTLIGLTDDAKNPMVLPFYVVGFGLAALARTNKRWAWPVVAAVVLLLIAVGIFYYPTIFVPARQTPLGWFENDVYMGLLIVAEYLCIQRLRGVTLAPAA